MSLLGMGNPLLDISADPVPQEFLDKYGLKLNDAILCEEKQAPCYADMVAQFPVQYIAGGATQNSIRVCQWMLQSKPNSTHYIGCVGKDAYGKQLKESAEADGVKTHYLEDEKQPTGTCAVLVKDKERSLCANLAAANCYKDSHMELPEIKAVIEGASIIYSAGFFLTVSPAAIQAASKHCAENKKTYCMNLSAIFIVDFFTDALKAALENVDILFGNESEAEAWGKKMEYADQSIGNIAMELSKFGGRKRIVVITQGSEPTVLAQEGIVTEFPVPPMAKESIVDSNGAGDAFVGGFLAALMSGKTLAECIKYGNYSASVILQVSGCVTAGKPAAEFAL
jgi:adenosine kinase